MMESKKIFILLTILFIVSIPVLAETNPVPKGTNAYIEALPYFLNGNRYLADRLYEEAILSYQKAIEINTYFLLAYRNMGNAYALKGCSISAADCFYKVGLLYFMINNIKMVNKTIEEMEELTPDSPLNQKLKDKLNEEKKE